MIIFVIAACSFLSLVVIIYMANVINELNERYGKLLDLTKDVIKDNKRANNDMLALLTFYRQVCDECKSKHDQDDLK